MKRLDFFDVLVIVTCALGIFAIYYFTELEFNTRTASVQLLAWCGGGAVVHQIILWAWQKRIERALARSATEHDRELAAVNAAHDEEIIALKAALGRKAGS